MDLDSVVDYFESKQTEICFTLEKLDGRNKFTNQKLASLDGNFSRPRVLQGDGQLEKAAVNFTLSGGDKLPPAAVQKNKDLANSAFRACSISVIVHPANPFVPTTHMNLRFFVIEKEEPVWYFGGGYDLTPIYGFEEDARDWHRQARDAVGIYYPKMKKHCDEYFFLPHRQEHRGIGGLFFDEWSQHSFEESFHLVKKVGDSFIDAYETIFKRRYKTPFEERHRKFQLLRRGRYAEFNLNIDRGTKYGIQSGRRIESVLASLPPLVSWEYDYHPPKNSEEALLTSYFLKPRDWI